MIPRTDLRTAIKSSKKQNLLPKFFLDVLTGEYEHSHFYKPHLNSHEQWYRISTIKAAFIDYHKYVTNKGTDTRFSFDAILKQAGHDWTNTKTGKFKAKVNDRSTEPPYSQCVCLKITKESVTELHRSLLHDKEW